MKLRGESHVSHLLFRLRCNHRSAAIRMPGLRPLPRLRRPTCRYKAALPVRCPVLRVLRDVSDLRQSAAGRASGDMSLRSSGKSQTACSPDRAAANQNHLLDEYALGPIQSAARTTKDYPLCAVRCLTFSRGVDALFASRFVARRAKDSRSFRWHDSAVCTCCFGSHLRGRWISPPSPSGLGQPG